MLHHVRAGSLTRRDDNLHPFTIVVDADNQGPLVNIFDVDSATSNLQGRRFDGEGSFGGNSTTDGSLSRWHRQSHLAAFPATAGFMATCPYRLWLIALNNQHLLTIIVDADTNWHVLPSPSRAVDSTEKAASHGTAARVPLISWDDGVPVKLTVTFMAGKNTGEIRETSVTTNSEALNIRRGRTPSAISTPLAQFLRAS